MFASLQVNLKSWRTAGEIAGDVEATLKRGRSSERGIHDWQARYGEGVEVKDGIPTVYRGVYLFVNGYAELRAMKWQKHRIQQTSVGVGGDNCQRAGEQLRHILWIERRQRRLQRVLVLRWLSGGVISGSISLSESRAGSSGAQYSGSATFSVTLR